MKSKITVEIDFDNGNRPVIQVHERNSDDVRDRLIDAVFQALGHHSRWFRVEFKHNTMTDGEAGNLWHLVPIDPSEYPEEIKLMIAHAKTYHDHQVNRAIPHYFPSRIGVNDDNEVEYTTEEGGEIRWGKVVAVKFTVGKVYYDILDDETAKVVKEIPSHFVEPFPKVVQQKVPQQ